MSAFVFSRVRLASLQDAGRVFTFSGDVALPQSRERSTPGYGCGKPSACSAGNAFGDANVFRRLLVPRPKDRSRHPDNELSGLPDFGAVRFGGGVVNFALWNGVLAWLWKLLRNKKRIVILSGARRNTSLYGKASARAQSKDLVSFIGARPQRNEPPQRESLPPAFPGDGFSGLLRGLPSGHAGPSTSARPDAAVKPPAPLASAQDDGILKSGAFADVSEVTS